MIKTVSFAPPRSASGSKTKSARPASGSSNSISSAKPAPSTPATISAEAARAVLQKRAVPSKVAASKTQEAAEVHAATKKAKGAPRVAPSQKPRQRAEETESPTAPVAAKPAESAPKAKRSRVPKDLAAQYGAAPETQTRRVVEVAPERAPRKRLNKAGREARSQLLRPDDEVLKRLERASEVARPTSKRARGWEFECGRCGRATRFQTAGALCECGAIAVKE